MTSECFPTDLRDSTKIKVATFEKITGNIIEDLETQLSCAQTLLRLLENRKSLVSFGVTYNPAYDMHITDKENHSLTASSIIEQLQQVKSLQPSPNIQPRKWRQ